MIVIYFWNNLSNSSVVSERTFDCYCYFKTAIFNCVSMIFYVGEKEKK